MKTLIHLSLAIALASGSLRTFAAKETDSPKLAKAAKPRIEVCFVLDTTGSMGGLIEGAKQKIWSIANEMVSARPTPDLRIGLVGFRDRGDDYVTKTVDLTNDIDAVYAQLKTFQAGGGGDEPESVNEALDAAVHKMSWSSDKNLLKIVFLVGDAPPHMDYAEGPKYQSVCEEAVKHNLIINSIQCGSAGTTAKFWKDIALLSEGSYVAIPQSGNMVAIDAPQDSELAELSRKLGSTVIAYGGEGKRREVAAKVAAAASAPAPVAADRLAYNSAAGVAIQGDSELLDGLSSGKFKLDSLKKDELPPDLQKLDQKDLKAEIEKKQKERAELQARVQKLSKERDEFIAAERKRLAAAGKGDSFDEKVAAIIHDEAARKGIAYDK